MLADYDVVSVIDRLVKRAVCTIPACEHATVTVEAGQGTLETVAGAEISAVAHHVDEPCPWDDPIFEAVHYREPRRVDDAETEQRWPGFRKRMNAAGFRSCLALPLPALRHPAVGCTLFSASPNEFSEHAVDLALLFAFHASATIDNAAVYDQSPGSAAEPVRRR